MLPRRNTFSQPGGDNFEGAARDAIGISRDDEGEEGVTIMAGGGGFFEASERDSLRSYIPNSIKYFVRL